MLRPYTPAMALDQGMIQVRILVGVPTQWISSMVEHAVDNRATEDRNLYPLPSNNDITASARRFVMCIIKYYTMKTILAFTVCFLVTFFLVSVLISASAAEPVKKPAPPPAGCSCGVCEDSR